MAYYQIEPWGDERADLRNGITASLIYNANRGKRSKAMKAADFIIKTKDNAKEKKQQSPEQQAQIARRLQAALGGLIKTNQK